VSKDGRDVGRNEVRDVEARCAEMWKIDGQMWTGGVGRDAEVRWIEI